MHHQLAMVVVGLATLVSFARVSALEVTNALIAGKRVTVCRVDTRKDQLRLFLYDDAGQPFKSFQAIEHRLQRTGQTLVFAMNAGMYQRGFSPVGLFVSDGKQVAPLNTNDGSGNFYLKPNGVFFVSRNTARILETSEYSSVAEAVALATQSGPLLVRNGKIHPAFNAASRSRAIRNGVGVVSSHLVVFAITEEPVNLHEFATLFRDILKCPDALYLDGVISSIHLPDCHRSDSKSDLGPIIGVVR